MKQITVNGRRCELAPLDVRKVKPGVVLGHRYSRRVYRVLCFDGDEVIGRNVRNDSILVVLKRQEIADEFGIVREL